MEVAEEEVAAVVVEEESSGAKRGKQREGGSENDGRMTVERGPAGVWQGARDPIGSRPGHIISGCSPR